MPDIHICFSVFRKFSAIIRTPGGQPWSEYVCLCHQNSLSRKRILREGARYVNECETSRKGEEERGEGYEEAQGMEGVMQPVSTGERGVITDISFQRSVRDIKVAWGNHYSDIVRSSLFRESLSLYIYFSFSFSLSRLPITNLFSSLFLCMIQLYLFLSRLYSRCLFECVAPFQARGRKRKKEAAPYQNSSFASPSPCRKSISQSANFHSYTSPE